jgi:hypothetical protein
VVQEGLTNVLKHARVDQCDVRVGYTGDGVEIVVTDRRHRSSSPIVVTGTVAGTEAGRSRGPWTASPSASATYCGSSPKGCPTPRSRSGST